MKLSVSAYRAHASAHKKILSSSYQSQLNYGSTAASSSAPSGLFTMEATDGSTSTVAAQQTTASSTGLDTDQASSQNVLSPTGTVVSTSETPASKDEEEDSSNAASSECKSPSQRTKSNQRWMKLRTTVQISSAIQKKPPLKREDSFLKRFSTRQIPEAQETVEDTGSESASGDQDKGAKRRRRYLQKRRSVVNPDENFYFYWLMALTFCILYNLWTLIVRQSFPELQEKVSKFWFVCDCITDIVFVLDIAVQLRTGYLEQGLMVYDDKKLACHYMRSREFLLDLAALIPLDLLQMRFGTQPLLRFPRFLKVYRSIKFYYIVESRTVWPNLWRVVNLIHILLILAHWFGCFYFLLSEAEGFQGDWVYPYRPGDYATLTRKYLGSLYWSTLTLTTIGDLPTPETNAEPSNSADGPRSLPRRGLKSRLLQFASNYGYIFTIVSYLIGVFIFATIVGQVGNVITNRNANRLEFERLLDGAKTYMRHHKVPGGMKRRVLRWYDYSWSRGRIQGGGDINTALGLLPDKLKTELALHVNLSVLKKVTIFQECQPEFLHDLVLKMKAYIFTPGDSICRKGEVAREMFIIADGILEVLSETGKVLTTMKAGDFFGEIGILNLDGLNKRTADVRSVGYSELFSLSREDVLAAMKDYPEAQEILQTLGRKRLMEVRCVNKKHAKAASEREAHIAQSGHTDNSSENSASKRIVDKFKSDVKGIKSVLRKSRTNRRSNESLEMQPLHGSISSNTSKSSKGMLRRMPRVRSDDLNPDNEELHETKDKTPSPIGAGLPLLQRLRLLKEKQDREERAVKSAPPLKSPPHTHVTSAVSPQESIQEETEAEVIGAGLPLLQRLQLLKAKEERLARESQAGKAASVTAAATTTLTPASSTATTGSSTTTLTSTTTTTTIPATTTCVGTASIVAGTSSKLQQLRSPTSPPSSNNNSQPPQPSSSTLATLKHAIISHPLQSNQAGTIIPSSLVSVTKPALKVSFRERIKEMQQGGLGLGIVSSSGMISNGGGGGVGGGISSSIGAATAADRDIANSLKEKLIPTISSKCSKPSTSSVFREKLKNLTHLPHPSLYSHPKEPTESSLKPWSKLKLATVVSSGSYSSLTNSSFEDNTKQQQQQQQKTQQQKQPSNQPHPNNTTLLITQVDTTSDTGGKLMSDTTIASIEATTTTATAATSTVIAEQVPRIIRNQTSTGMKLKPKKFQLTQRKPKCYRSVDDLSPEYGGLPFVKKLKILNERQKLAELESVIQTRSFSLDCTDSTSANATDLMEPLYRSHSDASGISMQPKIIATSILTSGTSQLVNHRAHKHSLDATSATSETAIQLSTAISHRSLVAATSTSSLLTTPHGAIIGTTGSLPMLPISVAAQTKAVTRTSTSLSPIVPAQPAATTTTEATTTNIPQCLRSPLSPESNETLERRQLKSILKKLNEDKTASSLISQETVKKNTQELKGLLTAQTVEGYVARHSKLMKSVTFNSTLSSPPTSANVCDSMEERSHFTFITNEQQEQLQQLQQQQQPLQIVTANIISTVTSPPPPPPPSTPSTPRTTNISTTYMNSTDTTCKLVNTTATDSAVVGGQKLTADDQLQYHLQTVTVTPPSIQKQQPHIQQSQYHEITKNNNDLISAQKKLMKGTITDEYFSEVLLGIKNVIQTHMVEFHSKFQDRFANLELEVRKRDEIINQLQSKIHELEVQSITATTTITTSITRNTVTTPPSTPTPTSMSSPVSPVATSTRSINKNSLNPICQVNRANSSGTGSSGSSGELPFMRGDSIDTIFSSSPPVSYDRQSSSTKTIKNRKRCSPRQRYVRKHHSWDESSDQESTECPHPLSGYRGMLVSDVTGNLTRVSSDSVVLDIDDTSSSSSSSSKTNLDDIDEERDDDDEAADEAKQLPHDDDQGNEDDDEDEGDDDEDDDGDGEGDENEDNEPNQHLHCDDWEIRMLAAELDRRESKKDFASSETLTDIDENGQLLRRRRKQSDTDTECSEIDVDVPSRPRAASLDQYNLRHSKSKNKSVFKAMSFDRDKDRL